MNTIKGFTLIELIVVITIIGVLVSLGATSYNKVQSSARDSKRIADAHAIKTALGLYYAKNGIYPNPGGSWRGECDHPWGTPNLAPEDVILGLVPDYLESFPSDPQMNKSFNSAGTATPCYLYSSDGADFALLLHNKHLGGDTDYAKEPTLLDPRRDGGPDLCLIDGAGYWSWKVATAGFACL